jgi:hypothetical protein
MTQVGVLLSPENKKVQWHRERDTETETERSSRKLLEVVILMQAMLHAVEGNSFAVTQAIALMLECAQEEDPEEGIVLEKASVEKTVEMVQDSNSSHLMEVNFWSCICGFWNPIGVP